MPLISSSTITFPNASRIFVFLSNSKLSEIITTPSFEITLPLFIPLNKFPLFKISISVTLNVKFSWEYADPKKFNIIKKRNKILFFIYFLRKY